MSEQQAVYKVNTHGGSRGGGRPRKLKGGKYIKVYVDEATIKKLKKIGNNQSLAVRLAVKSYPLTSPERKLP